MDFDDYQKKSTFSIVLPDLVSDLKYLGLALAGETGEVAEKIKKLFRDADGKMDDAKKTELIKEMGDVFWYLARMADSLKIPLSQVAEMNLEKLKSRVDRQKIHGAGDNR